LLGIYAVGYRILDSANSLLVGIARKIAVPGLLTTAARSGAVEARVLP
jgi:hypothetical protein